MNQKKKKPIIDREILSVLNDYQLFLDGDKFVNMPFLINSVDKNHVTSLKGSSTLSSIPPFGNTILECEMRDKNEYNYSFNILSDRIQSRVLFRMDEGNGTHRNRHLNIPIDQQQVPTPHFHKVASDGVMFAYRTKALERLASPLNIRDGFSALCDEIHIIHKDRKIEIQEEGALPLEFAPEMDPLIDIIFP